MIENKNHMLNRVEDQQAIDQLLQGWLFRDMSDWKRLRKLFHDDGMISLSWFEGRFQDFVDASMSMGKSAFISRHTIGTPMVQWSGNKALAQTAVAVIGEDVEHNVGFVSHARFVDCVGRRDGVWKIVRRDLIYDMSFFTFPAGPMPINQERLRQHPREYAALAYVLDQCGFAVHRMYATRGSELESAIQSAAQDWLGQG